MTEEHIIIFQIYHNFTEFKNYQNSLRRSYKETFTIVVTLSIVKKAKRIL